MSAGAHLGSVRKGCSGLLLPVYTGCPIRRTLMFDFVRFLGNFCDFFETGLLWLKKIRISRSVLERNGLVSCTTEQ